MFFNFSLACFVLFFFLFIGVYFHSLNVDSHIHTEYILWEISPKYCIFRLPFCNLRAWGRGLLVIHCGVLKPQLSSEKEPPFSSWWLLLLLLLSLPPPTQTEEEKKMSHSLQNRSISRNLRIRLTHQRYM